MTINGITGEVVPDDLAETSKRRYALLQAAAIIHGAVARDVSAVIDQAEALLAEIEKREGR